MARPRHRASAGFTYIELMIVCVMILVLTAMAIPVGKYTQQRRKELELHYDLRLMRRAIDQYKAYSDAGLLRVDVDTFGYPKDLETLVEGVTLVGQATHKMKFLRRIPIDPMTGKARWGLRSLQDEWDSTSWGGQNVYDVYSLSPGKAIDGTHYRDW